MFFAWNPRKGLPFLGGETFVRRERLWDQTGDLRYGGFLTYRNPEPQLSGVYTALLAALAKPT
jgi:hypothetical protein